MRSGSTWKPGSFSNPPPSEKRGIDPDKKGPAEDGLLVCPECGGTMKVVAFITNYPAVDRIIDHLKLRFVAEKPPPSHVFEQVALMAAEEQAEYF
jgi:hypothetical protein